MNIKTIGYVGAASVALALLAPSLSVADTVQATDHSGNLVHRVSHALAADARYTAPVSSSGNKWAEKPVSNDSKVIWADSDEPQSGYKWGQSNGSVNLDQAVENVSEQAGNRWRRRDVSEQAGNRWRRRDVTEQTGNRWRRRDVSEQTGNRWRRRDVSEQTGNRWRRRDVSEQTGNRWRRR
jgi:hypothetical protein